MKILFFIYLILFSVFMKSQENNYHFSLLEKNNKAKSTYIKINTKTVLATKYKCKINVDTVISIKGSYTLFDFPTEKYHKGKIILEVYVIDKSNNINCFNSNSPNIIKYYEPMTGYTEKAISVIQDKEAIYIIYLKRIKNGTILNLKNMINILNLEKYDNVEKNKIICKIKL